MFLLVCQEQSSFRSLLVCQVKMTACATKLLRLYADVAGAFIFVGGCELVATEFSGEANRGKNRVRRGLLFLAVFAGFVLVALLQLVHG